MFFWQEWDIVTILQLLATWPAGAASLYVSVRGVAAAGRAVETSVCRGATVKLSRWNNRPCWILSALKSESPNFSLHLHCAAFSKRARPKYNKANYRNSFLSFEMTMPRNMFGDVTTECSIFAATAPALSICSNYWKKRVCSSFAVRKKFAPQQIWADFNWFKRAIFNNARHRRDGQSDILLSRPPPICGGRRGGNIKVWFN